VASKCGPAASRRQRGTRFHRRQRGRNDDTLFALIDRRVLFTRWGRERKRIHVVPLAETAQTA
jgi:ribosomal protein L27